MTPTASYNQTDILSRVSSGDEQAFAQLFAQYRDTVYATSLRLTESVADAEEIVQDVFTKIWVKRETLVSVDNFEAYMYTMARNYAFNAIRKKLRERKKGSSYSQKIELTETPADHQFLMKDYEELLQKAVDRLPPQQKIVYELIKRQELSKAEVAEQLQLSIHTVKSHHDAAVKSIRTYYLRHLEVGLLLIFLY